MSDEHTPFALVVDDDALIRMDATDLLEDAGFRVLEAANPEAAIDILEKKGESIQLLFTDVQMRLASWMALISHENAQQVGRMWG